MSVVMKTPDEVATEWLVHLKTLKPSVNIDQTDSDWWIRSRVVGGVVSGAYGDLKKISTDAFPQSSRKEATARHLETFLADTFRPAQASVGSVIVSGATGTVVPASLEMVYGPNGNTYLTTESITLSATTGLVAAQSVGLGQAQNLLSGAVLTISSPPGGLDATATVAAGGMADGRNEETNEEAAARVLARVRQPSAGGTETDYQNFALAADPSVTGANVLRFVYGLGTVGVVITAGTTDIDAAVDNDEAVVRVPSDALLETVQNYVDAVNPLTDCLHMLKPQEISQDVTFRVRWAEGYNGATVPAGQSKTLLQLVEREIGRALYKVPTGGRHIGASGYIIASEIEEVVDIALSASPYQTGVLAEAIMDRAVEDLTASGANRLLRPTEIVIPGVITIVEET